MTGSPRPTKRTTAKREGGRQVDLASYIERRRSEGQTVINAGARQFVIDSPEFWPEAFHDAARSGDDVGVAKALLGSDFPAFVKACGTTEAGAAAILDGLFTEAQGATAGE